MKKLICILSVFTLTFSSCSSDESSASTTDPSAVLPKKIIEEGPDGSYTDTFFYNGNKLTKIESTDGQKDVFTYTGDLITKVETFYDGELGTTELYGYDNSGRLISYTVNNADSPSFNSQETYVHNSNGTISYTRNLDGEVYSTGIFTMTGNDILNVVSNYDFGFGPFTTTNSYTYDAKFSPFKNILGFKWYAFAGAENVGFGFDHNVLTFTDSETPSNNSTSTYTYNALNFPVTSTFTEDGETLTETITYN
jgi:hypothetical protein